MTTNRRSLVLVAAVLLLVGLFPLLRLDAAARQRAWESACTRDGGWIEVLPPESGNRLVVQTGHAISQCRSAAGVVLSRRD